MQLVKERRHLPCSGTTQRMTQRNRSTIWIYPVHAQTKRLDRPACLTGKGLVDLVHTHVILTNASLGQRRWDGVGRTHAHDVGWNAHDTVRSPYADDGQSTTLGFGAAHHEDGRGTIGELAGISGCRAAGWIECGAELGQSLDGRAWTDSIVFGNDGAIGQRYRDNLVAKSTSRLRDMGPPVRFSSKSIQRLSVHPVLFDDVLTGNAHGYQTVRGILISQLFLLPLDLIPIYIRRGHAIHRMGAHTFDAATDADFNLSRCDGVGDVGAGLQTRGALPIGSREADRVREAGGQLRHSRSSRSRGWGQDVANAHIFHCRGFDESGGVGVACVGPVPKQHASEDGGQEGRGRRCREGSSTGSAERSSDGADDNDVSRRLLAAR